MQKKKLRSFSALQRAEIAEMAYEVLHSVLTPRVSVLFNEPKLLKFQNKRATTLLDTSFSALQRAEIAEILPLLSDDLFKYAPVSVLFNEPKLLKSRTNSGMRSKRAAVSVLFNEPKLLKST